MISQSFAPPRVPSAICCMRGPIVSRTKSERANGCRDMMISNNSFEDRNGWEGSRGFIKRRNKIDGQFSARQIDMLESPAWRVLSLSAHRVIDRISIELGHHGGNDNGRLVVTFDDFVEYGITREAIAPAIREAEALGFIRVTERGRGGNAEYRKPNAFFLTFVNSRSSKVPTHEWRKVKTIEEAETIARVARGQKDSRAVEFAERRKTESRYGKPALVPVRKTHTETDKSPVRETPTTGSVGKPPLLPMSWVGGSQVYTGSNPSNRYPIAKATHPYNGYSSLPIELRLLALGLPGGEGEKKSGAAA